MLHLGRFRRFGGRVLRRLFGRRPASPAAPAPPGVEPPATGTVLIQPDRTAWTVGARAPAGLLDAGGAQIGHLLYVIRGYKTQGEVNDDIFVFDLHQERWLANISAPPGLAHSHCAVASDGERFIYFASGQRGPDCRPAIGEAFSYDTLEDRWQSLPAVPSPRYAATIQLWRGRLHLLGGAAEDRWTPRADHWSLAVAGGVATEAHWRQDEALPTAGMHRGSAVLRDQLFVFGGQQGDFMAVPGDPDCTCTGATPETYLAAAFRLSEPDGSWSRLAEMPVAASHLDFATLVHDDRILLFGGQIYKHPERFYLKLTNAIQAYDAAADRWSIVGYLPNRLKTPVVGQFGDSLFVTTGQRSVLPDGESPGPITADTWKTSLSALLARTTPAPAATSLAGKSILMISHDLSRSGSPLLLLETARGLLDRGASVRVASASDDVAGWNLACEYRVPVIPIEAAIDAAMHADWIIANTAADPTKRWVAACLAKYPGAARKLAWWVHEIDVETYASDAGLIRNAAVAIFDSKASQAAWAAQTRLPPSHVLHPGLADSFLRKTAQERLPFPADPATPTHGNPSLTRDEVRAHLQVAPEDFLLCAIGGFSRRKSQRLLIRTAARAAGSGVPVKLVLVGLADANERATLLGGLSADEQRVLSPARAYVTQPEHAAFYLASDAYVMNSQGDTGRGECFGRVTTEALAFGLPVIGTNAGGTPEIIDHGSTGLLFPLGPDGQGELARHIVNLARDRALARRLGAAGRAMVRDRFSQDACLSRLEQILQTFGGA